jgi:putative peptidoglycan lipid II flippase
MRLVISLRGNYWVLWISGLGFGLNALLNYLFMRWLGVAGIALSTSVVYALTFFAFWFVVDKLLLKAESDQKASRNL